MTEKTFDAYLYQLVESKQKFISQIMTSKSPVRAAEDVDEAALSYAEIKMLATGNPHIKEKMDLDIQVSKLKLLKQNHLSERYELEDRLIKGFPEEIKALQELIEGYQADIVILEEHKLSEEQFIMRIGGAEYTEKADAGAAIVEACNNKTTPEPSELGQYRGLKMELEYETFSTNFQVILTGKARYRVTLGTDPNGNITRINNALAHIPDKLKIGREKLENVLLQVENTKLEIKKEFPQETELQEKVQRLNELNAILDVENQPVANQEEAAQSNVSDRICEREDVIEEVAEEIEL